MTTNELGPPVSPPAKPPVTAQPPAAQPPRYKQAILTWLGVYPALTVTLAILTPLMEGWPLPLRTLLVTLLLVPALTWVIFPLLRRVLSSWLIRRS